MCSNPSLVRVKTEKLQTDTGVVAPLMVFLLPAVPKRVII